MVNIDWSPDSKALRKFGLVVIIGCAIIGLTFQFVLEKDTVAKVVFIAGGAIGLPALTGTKVALPDYFAWMGFAFVMGNIMSRVLLTMVYLGLFAPMGLAMRLTGRDSLLLKKRGSSTYWRDMDPASPDASKYERQF